MKKIEKNVKKLIDLTEMLQDLICSTITTIKKKRRETVTSCADRVK